MTVISTEDKIAKFMITVSKFEFFLICERMDLAAIKFDQESNLQKIAGIQWEKLGDLIEKRYKFLDFDFAKYKFLIFKETSPQYLVKSPDSEAIKWDSDERPIDSWSRLLTRSFAQFRNNIAHGNKGHLLAPLYTG